MIALPSALAGVDAVVSVVGVARMADARRTAQLFSEGTRNVRAAMTAVGVHRLVVVSSLGVVDSARDDRVHRLLDAAVTRAHTGRVVSVTS